MLNSMLALGFAPDIRVARTVTLSKPIALNSLAISVLTEATAETFFDESDDDVITSSGYRIGPGEIEDCLAGHPDVQLAAAVGKPDPIRTEIVKAYVVLKPGAPANDETAAGIRDWVKTRLSMHEYPREIDFVESLPLTTSGKVIRRLLREKAAAEIAAGP
jgi:acetyl-CoA synthetase